jgi:hypothetical protein
VNDGRMRVQQAVEYLMTYGWMILILIGVLGVLYTLGVFKQGSVAPNICALPANVGCVSAALFPNGILTVNIQQATQYTINVVAIGCNTQGTANALSLPNVIIPIGGNSTFALTCYTSTWATYNAAIGAAYTGYLLINYTDLSTGFTHTASGSLIQKVV